MKKIFFLLSCCLLMALMTLNGEEKLPPKLAKYLTLSARFPHQDYLFEKTWKLFQKSALPSLAPFVEKKLQQNQKNPSLWILLARIYRRENKDEKALSCLKKAQELSPSNSYIFQLTGRIYRNRGEIGLAIQSYQKALKHLKGQGKKKIYRDLGNLYFEQGEIQKACRSWKSLLSNPPTAKEIQRVVSLLETHSLYGQAERTIQTNKIHIARPLEKLRLLDTLARVRMIQGKFQQALSPCDEILRQTQEGHWLRDLALEKRRKIYFRLGRLTQLIQLHQKNISQNSTEEDYRELAKIYIQQNSPLLKGTLKTAQKGYPNSPYFFRQLTRLYLAGKKYSQAASIYEKWCANHPSQIRSWVELGEIYWKANQRTRALACWKNIISLQPTPRAYLQYASILFDHRLPKKALALLTKGAGLFPKGMEFQIRSARLALSKGQKDWAQKKIDSVLRKKNKISPTELYQLLYRHGFYGQAIQVLSRGKKPSAPTLWNLARSYIQLKKYQKAISALLQAYRLSKKPIYLEKILSLQLPPSALRYSRLKLKEIPKKNRPIYWALGQLCERMRQEQQAIQWYEKILKPGEIQARRRLARLYSFDHPQKALVIYQKLLQIDKTHSSRYLWQLSSIYRYLQREKDVQKIYDQLSKSGHLKREIYIEMALYYRNSSPKKALNLLRKANVEYPANYQILKLLFELTRHKNPKEALVRLYQMSHQIQNPKKKRAIHRLLVQTYLSLGRKKLAQPKSPTYGRAKDYFEQALLYAQKEEKVLVRFYLLKYYLAIQPRSKALSQKVIGLYHGLWKKSKGLLPLGKGHFIHPLVFLQMNFHRLNDREKGSLPSLKISNPPAFSSASLFPPLAKTPGARGEVIQKYQVSTSYGRLRTPMRNGNLIWYLNGQNRLTVLDSRSGRTKSFPITNWYPPLISRGMVYTSGKILKGYPLTVQGLSRKKPLWTFGGKAFRKIFIGTYRFIPIRALKRQLLVLRGSHLFCLDRFTGQLLWVRRAGRLPYLYAGRYSASYPSREIPRVFLKKGELVMIYRYGIEKLSLLTGELIWRKIFAPQKRLLFLPSSPLMGKHLFLPQQNRIVKWDLDRGLSVESVALPKHFSYSYYAVLIDLAVSTNSVLALVRARTKGRYGIWLYAYDRANLKLQWKKLLPLFAPHYRFTRTLLKVWKNRVYVSSLSLRAYRIKDGANIWQDPFRKILFSTNMQINLSAVSSPLIFQNTLAFLDTSGKLYLYRRGTIPVGPKARTGKPSWKSLSLARPVKSFFKKIRTFSLGLRDIEKGEGAKIRSSLQQSTSFRQALGDFQKISAQYKIPLKRLLLVFSPTQKKKYISVFQPYFYRYKGFLGLPNWKLQKGVVIYLSPEAKGEILAGKILQSGLLRAMGEAFLQQIYGFFNLSQLSLSRMMELFQNNNRKIRGTSSSYYSFIKAFGVYVEMSYSFSSPVKKSLVKILGSPKTYVYYTNIPIYYRQYQAIFLLSLEGRSGRKKILTVLAKRAPQKLGAFLENYWKEYPKDKKNLVASLKIALGNRLINAPKYRFSDLLRDTERGLRKLDGLFEKSYKKLFRR